MSSMEFSRIGEQIRAQRELRGWTQAELAKRLEVSQSFLDRIENNLGLPESGFIEHTAGTFGITTEQLANTQVTRVESLFNPSDSQVDNSAPSGGGLRVEAYGTVTPPPDYSIISSTDEHDDSIEVDHSNDGTGVTPPPLPHATPDGTIDSEEQDDRSLQPGSVNLDPRVTQPSPNDYEESFDEWRASGASPLTTPEEGSSTNNESDLQGDLGSTTEDDDLESSGSSSSSSSPSEEFREPTEEVSFKTGGGLHISREVAKENACLGVMAFAHAVATFIQSVKGDLSFAIFGPWGRGKTYLTKFICDELDKEKYSPIEFSAWRFRATPEIWIYLYETVLERVRKNNELGSIGVAIRKGILKNGYLPYLFAIISLGATITPVSAIGLNIGWAFVSCFGFIGLLIVYQAISGTTLFIQRIKADYLSLSSHGDKLGLQGLIGQELVALIRGWIPNDTERSQLWVATTRCLLGILIPSVIMLAAYVLIWQNSLEQVPLPNAIHFGITLAVWWLISALFIGAIWIGIPTINKVFLVVDDLDRCGTEEILPIIESLKVILDDRDLADRVQIVMLVEEDILEGAIERKYSRLFPHVGDKEETSKAKKRMIREHIEKLFLSYVRMPTLTQDDIEQLVSTFLSEQRSNSASQDHRDKRNSSSSDATTPASGGAQSPEDRIRMTGSEGSRGRIGQSIPIQDESLKQNGLFEKLSIDGEEAYSEFDEGVLRSVLGNQTSLSVLGPSPRSIRCWLFKFQLARLLLRVNHAEASPNELAYELMIAYQCKCTGSKSISKRFDLLRYIAEAVA